MKVRRKPVELEALRYDGNNGWQIERWSSGKVYHSLVLEPTKDNPTGCYLQIDTLEGMMTAIVGDYIIKVFEGEFYPVKAGIFKKIYEVIDENY